MDITVLFDCYAKKIYCEGLEIADFSDLVKSFEEWLYEDCHGCLCVKESLGIAVLDINVVVRFLKEKYPNVIITVDENRIPVQDVNERMQVIVL